MLLHCDYPTVSLKLACLHLYDGNPVFVLIWKTGFGCYFYRCKNNKTSNVFPQQRQQDFYLLVMVLLLLWVPIKDIFLYKNLTNN